MSQARSAARRWRGIELRHLAAFRAVGETGSFHAAAAALGYTQSAISQQIAALERAVGVRLVERPGGSKPVALTPSGELLLEHARSISARVAAAEADLAAHADGSTPLLRVGAYESVAVRVLPTLFRRLRMAEPATDVELVEAADDVRLARALERGDVELAFLDLPLPPGPFDHVELIRDPYVLVVRRDSRLARARRALTAREVAALPLVCFRNCRCTDRVLRQLAAHGIEPRIAFRADSNQALQAVVAEGLGVALLPQLAYDENDDTTVAVPLGDVVAPRLIALAWHCERRLGEVARAFIELAGDEYGRRVTFAEAATPEREAV